MMMRWHVGVVRVSTLSPQFMCCDLSLSPSWPAVVATWLGCPLNSISAHNLFLPSAITCQHHTEEASGGAHDPSSRAKFTSRLFPSNEKKIKVDIQKDSELSNTNIDAFLVNPVFPGFQVQDLMLVVLMMLCEHIIVTFSRFLWWQTLTLMAWPSWHTGLVTRQSPAT